MRLQALLSPSQQNGLQAVTQAFHQAEAAKIRAMHGAPVAKCSDVSVDESGHRYVCALPAGHYVAYDPQNYHRAADGVEWA